MGEKRSSHFTADNIKDYKVDKETTLLPFLFEIMSEKSRTDVKSMLAHRHIAIRGKAVTQFDTPLLPGDVVQVNFGRSFYKFQNPQVRIIYEDEWLVVIEKASGLLSVANDTAKEKNAFHIMQDYLRHSNPNAELYVCHRLDQYTSGILMFAKNRDLQRELRENWDFYVKERRYMCVTEAVPEQKEGEIQSYLTQNDRLQVHSTDDEEEGALAITRYRVVQSKGRYALVDVEILTGKKNQIRVHMTEMGCPIAGDMKYGAETNPCRRLMLHNYRLSFIHPVSGEMMRFSLNTPNVFRRITDPQLR